MKVVVNRCYGGFGLSPKAVKHYLALKGLPCFFYVQTKYKHEGGRELYERKKLSEPKESVGINYSFTKDLGPSFENFPNGDDGYFYDRNIERNDPLLVQTVEKLGKAASDRLANLVIVEIPDDVEWEIEEYDGQEWIAEKHRTW